MIRHYSDEADSDKHSSALSASVSLPSCYVLIGAQNCCVTSRKLNLKKKRKKKQLVPTTKRKLSCQVKKNYKSDLFFR